MYLIKFEDNYADEYDVTGTMVMTNSRYRVFNELIKLRGLLHTLEEFCDIENNTIDQKEYECFLGEIDYDIPLDLVIEMIPFIPVEPFEVYFGTNESFVYDCFNEFLNTIKVTKISEEDYKVLKRLDLVNTGTINNLFELVLKSLYVDWIFNIETQENDKEKVREHNAMIDKFCQAIKF